MRYIPLEEKKEAAREDLDETVDAKLNDLVLEIVLGEAGVLLGMGREEAIEFIDKIWHKQYLKTRREKGGL